MCIRSVLGSYVPKTALAFEVLENASVSRGCALVRFELPLQQGGTYWGGEVHLTPRMQTKLNGVMRGIDNPDGYLDYGVSYSL